MIIKFPTIVIIPTPGKRFEVFVNPINIGNYFGEEQQPGNKIST